MGPVAVLVLLLFFAHPPAQANNPIGEIMVVTGTLNAEGKEGRTRSLSKGSALFEQDRVRTGDKSFAMLRLADDTKIALRPNSEIVLDKFNKIAGQEASQMNVIQGGLRVLTGTIGKVKPDAVTVNTRYASMGIRGTEFVIRLCGERDCKQEDQALTQFDPVPSPSCPNRLEGVPEGDYIVAYHGQVYVRQASEQIELRKNEGAYSRQTDMRCIGELPNFIVHDPFLVFPIVACETSKVFNKPPDGK